MKTKLKKSRFRKPYNTAGKTNFPDTQKKSGVYVIRENLKVVYVGTSASNLYKTMYRHFQKWNHPLQPVVSYANRLSRNRYDVSVTICGAVKAEKLERGLIKLLKPRDNPNKLKFYEATQTEIALANDWIETKSISDEDLPF